MSNDNNVNNKWMQEVNSGKTNPNRPPELIEFSHTGPFDIHIEGGVFAETPENNLIIGDYTDKEIDPLAGILSIQATTFDKRVETRDEQRPVK